MNTATITHRTHLPASTHVASDRSTATGAAQKQRTQQKRLWPALVAALSLSALGAQAQSAASAPTAPLSRAEVRAEFLRAQKAGELPSSADLYGPALNRALLEASQAARVPSGGSILAVTPAYASSPSSSPVQAAK